MKNSKSGLRQLLKTQRRKVSRSEIDSASASIFDNFINFVDWTKVKRIHLYLPIEFNSEVDTWRILKWIWTNLPEIQTSTSIYGESRSMRHVVISPDTTFKTDRLGIPVPETNYGQLSTKYDIIIIPVLGFDKSLNRIGYGQGVYDSFLSQQPESQKIGLAYESSKVSAVPTEPHDVQLNEIITERKLYKASH